MLTAEIPLPWHKVYWEQLLNQVREARFPSAILFKGNEGLGKFAFAKVLTNRLLCQSPWSLRACDQCRSCQLFFVGNHPDICYVEPEEVGKAIKIDQIRQLIDFAYQSSQIGGYKIILINQAEKMNRAAANALLKMLEEPSEQLIIFLISSNQALIPATIRSRCQGLQFQMPHTSIAHEWLIKQGINSPDIPLLLLLSQGAPLKAISLYEKNSLEKAKKFFNELNGLIQKRDSTCITKISDSWTHNDINLLLDWTLIWLNELSYLLFDSTKQINHDIILFSSVKMNRIKIFELLSWIYNLKHQVNSLQLNINQTLLVETLFIKINRLSSEKEAVILRSSRNSNGKPRE